MYVFAMKGHVLRDGIKVKNGIIKHLHVDSLTVSLFLCLSRFYSFYREVGKRGGGGGYECCTPRFVRSLTLFKPSLKS